jgi:hypothetical protein
MTITSSAGLAAGRWTVDPAHSTATFRVANLGRTVTVWRGLRAWPAAQSQSTTAPPVKLISLAVMVRAQSDAAKAAMLPTSS